MSSAIGTVPEAQTERLSPQMVTQLRRLHEAMTITVLFIGTLVLTGWLLEVDWLKSFIPGAVTTKANTALGFLLAGLALWWRNDRAPRWQQRLAQGAAGLIALLGLLTIAEYWFGWQLGIDQLFLHTAPPASLGAYPGRMALPTACCFLLIGSALIGLDLPTNWGRPAEWLALTVGFIALAALIGHIYNAERLITPFELNGMALPTAIGFIALCWGTVTLRPQQGVMAHFWSSGPQGLTARRLTVGGITTLLLLSILTHAGNTLGLYGHDTESTLLLALNIAILLLFVGQSTWALARLEQERQAGLVAFQEQYALLQGIINSTHDGIYVRDLAGRYLLVNQTGAATVGLTPTEMVGKSYRDLFAPAIAEQVAAEDQAVIQTGQPHVQEMSNSSAGAVTVWHSVKTPYRDFAGKTVGVLNVVRDITERRQAEEQLRDSQQEQAELLALLTALLDNAPIGFAFFDHTLRFIRVNQKLADLNGLPISAHVGRPLTAVLPTVGRQLSPLIEQVFATGQGIYQQVLSGANPTDPANVRHVLSSWYPVRVDEGGVRYVGAVIVDVTDFERAKADLHALNNSLEQRVVERTAELERSNRELDRFAYVASHDLKAPLRAIVNLATWITDDAGALLPPPSQAHLAKLKGRTLRMERLLDDLLAYSRIGRRTDTVEAVATATLVQDAVALLAPPPGFRVRLVSELPTLRTPRAPLALIFRNLIGNAIKHHPTPETGEVQISAEAQGDFICFAVRDNGAGIDPRYHERIFELFQTLQPRDEVEGSGMGLAFVKKTVEHYKGKLWVESAVGAGAAFYFTWPAAVNQPVT